MREIQAESIAEAVAELCIKTNLTLADGMTEALEDARGREISPQGRMFLEILLENSKIALKEKIPLCQDCGIPVFFVELGREAVITGGSLEDALNRGVREGYARGFLRKSMVNDPVFDRKNTQDGAPAVIHLEMTEGNGLSITFSPKGGGSENMTALKMMNPSAGPRGIIDFAVKTVEEAGSAPCPPVIVGVGIGGVGEKAVLLSKKALLRPVGSFSKDERYRALEEEILNRINSLGIGPGGLGGKFTCLFAAVEHFPCHMATLPVAVSIQCHCRRHGRIVL